MLTPVPVALAGVAQLFFVPDGRCDGRKGIKAGPSPVRYGTPSQHLHLPSSLLPPSILPELFPEPRLSDAVKSLTSGSSMTQQTPAAAECNAGVGGPLPEV